MAALFGLIVYYAMTFVMSEFRATATLAVPIAQEEGQGLRGAIFDADDFSITRVRAALQHDRLAALIVSKFAMDQQSDVAQALNVVMERLDVADIAQNAIRVSFRTPDPELAVAVANYAVEAFAEALRQHDAARRAEAVRVIDTAIATSERELSDARSHLDSLRASHVNPADDTAITPRMAEELQGLEQERLDNERRAEEIRAAIAQGRAEKFINQSAVPVARQLMDVKTYINEQRDKLSKTLPPDHPRLQELAADLAGIDKQLAAFAAADAEKLDQSVLALRQAEAKLRTGSRKRRPEPVLTEGQRRALSEAETAVTDRAAELARLRAITKPRDDVQSASLELSSSAARIVSADARKWAVVAGAFVSVLVGGTALVVLAGGRRRRAG